MKLFITISPKKIFQVLIVVSVVLVFLAYRRPGIQYLQQTFWS